MPPEEAAASASAVDPVLERLGRFGAPILQALLFQDAGKHYCTLSCHQLLFRRSFLQILQRKILYWEPANKQVLAGSCSIIENEAMQKNQYSN